MPAAATYEQCARDYIDSRWARGEISLETRRSFRETLGLLGDALGEGRRISAVTRGDIERWLGRMKVSPATVRLRLSTTRGFWRWAILEGHARMDPTLGIKGPKKPRTVPRGLSALDVEKLLVNVEDDRDRLILLLMVEEGLRAIEVANLQVGDVDLNGRTIIVQGKGGHSRVLPVTDVVAGAIAAHLGRRGHHGGYLLQSLRNYANSTDGLTPKHVARLAGEAFRRAGLRETGHALRHTFAHGLIDAGASIRDVQGALGHASMNTTQVYLGRADVAQLRNFMGRRAKPNLALYEPPSAPVQGTATLA